MNVPRGFRAEPSFVSVEVSGAEARVSNLLPSDFQASVTLPRGFAGDTLVEAQVTAPAVVQVTRVAASRLRVYRP